MKTSGGRQGEPKPREGGSGRQKEMNGEVVGGEDKRWEAKKVGEGVGGGDNEWWEAKPSKGDEWGEVAGGGRQN